MTTIEFKQKVKTHPHTGREFITLKKTLTRNDVVSRDLPNHDLAMSMLYKRLRKQLDIIVDMGINEKKFYLDELPEQIKVDTSDFLAVVTVTIK